VNQFSQVCIAAIVGLGIGLAGSRTSATPGQSFEEASRHWAYQPLSQATPPRVRQTKRVQTPIDAFLLSSLEQKGMSFSPPADKRTLLRRVYYDLIGLPPTFEEIQAFERDKSKIAFSKVVERLLASPRYGERWGRHWLDVARYADTKDLVLTYGKDALRPYAYTYRDYVIRAFNEDLPFNQFVQDQIAADLEPNLPRWRLAALGFLTLGRMFDNNPHDQIDDQIDTTTRGFLGLTVACARCHDHKYDAITQRDYYSLYGVFASSERPYSLPLLEEPKSVPGGEEFEKKLAAAKQELEQHIDAEFAKLTEIFRQRIGDYLVRAATTKPDLTETTQFGLSLTPDDFRPTLVLRTRRLLEQRLNRTDRVFGPWAELMELPDEEFPVGAHTKMEPHVHSTCNPLVVSALARATLTNKTAIGRAYGDLLRDVYEESKKPAAGNPNGALNADQRELLELVTGKESPVWFPRRDTPVHMSRAETDRYGALVANLDKLAANATNAPPARAMVLAELAEPYQPHIFKRGNPSRFGDAVPRAFLQVLSGGTEPAPFQRGSGRLELAEAIVSPSSPLTARVFVNRVWMEHFGEPLVASPTDFGARSEKPANLAMLDWLASDFIRSGWSVKHLHRVILLSAAYQQAASPHPGPLPSDGRGGKVRPPSGTASGERGKDQRLLTSSPTDVENKLLSHFPRRRLDFEAMRDSLLFSSGQLELTMGGRPVDVAGEPLNRRRTVYGLVDRQNLPALFRAFDFPVPDQCLERRPHTTVPQQALFALNSVFVMEQARALAARPEIANTPKPPERVDALFRRVLGRRATKQEISSSLRFVEAAKTDEASANSLNPWEQLAQVVLVCNEAVFLD